MIAIHDLQFQWVWLEAVHRHLAGHCGNKFLFWCTSACKTVLLVIKAVLASTKLRKSRLCQAPCLYWFGGPGALKSVAQNQSLGCVYMGTLSETAVLLVRNNFYILYECMTILHIYLWFYDLHTRYPIFLKTQFHLNHPQTGILKRTYM